VFLFFRANPSALFSISIEGKWCRLARAIARSRREALNELHKRSFSTN
jgi:hypothetical protein